MRLLLDRKHLPELDGIRGVAVLSVILHHGFGFELGWFGVELFFALSGYLITGILLDAKGKLTGWDYFRGFYGRRSLRIFPLYYLVLVLVFIVLPAIAPAPFALFDPAREHAIWFWTYTQNILFAREGNLLHGVFHLWSLAVEEQFYLLFPLLIYLLGTTALLWVLPLLCVAGIVSRMTLFTGYPGYYVLLPCRLDSLLVGAMLALLVRTHRPLVERHLRRAALISGGLALVVIAGAYPNLGWGGVWFRTGGYTVFALAFGCLILFSVSDLPWAQRIFGHPLLTAAGTYSYGLYVYHYVIHSVMRPYLDSYLGQFIASRSLVKLAGSLPTLALTIVVSVASYHLFEKHFLQLKRYL